ncbi:hypothetical protein QJS10_CPA16g01324 [Acorus calamus]|uniref:Glycine-rich protein n=1 Tax=Acorus calamus TaxID=4465 RepID=A0AAV9D0R7_ACOCL|nr:hypothetical protein QJS10_CPA16g01324 [Acorus calamus]
MKLLLHFFMLFLATSHLLLMDAIPISRSRSLALMDEGMSSLDMMDIGGGALEVDELEHGRMDIESNDYPGSGANNRHDPRSPGRP